MRLTAVLKPVFKFRTVSAGLIADEAANYNGRNVLTHEQLDDRGQGQAQRLNGFPSLIA